MARHRESGVPVSGIADGGTGAGSASTGRPLHPRAVLRVAVPVLRLRRHRRVGGAWPDAVGSASSSTRSWWSSSCAPMRSSGGSASRDAAAAAARLGVSRRRDAVAAASRRGRRAILARVRERFGLAEDAEITIEANPGPDERGDPAALRRAGVTRISFGAQSLDDTELRKLGRRHRAAARGRRGRRAPGRWHRLGQPRPAVRHPGHGPGDLDGDARRGARAGARPPVALRAVARRPRCRGPDRADRDHLPTTTGARRWREPRPGAARTRTARRAVPPCRVALADAGYRGYEISNWARPGHESRHNLAYWQRRPERGGRTGRPCVRRRRSALDRRATRPVRGRAGAPRPPQLPPGGVGGAGRGDRRGRGADPRATPGHWRAPGRWPTSRRMADVFGWALAAGLLTVDPEGSRRADDARASPLE